MNRLLIIGASGHGKVCADIARLNGYEEIIFFDDNTEVQKCGQYEVAGNSDEVFDYDGDCFVAIGNPNVREKIVAKLNGRHIATLIHSNAVIAEDVIIGEGTAVMAGAVINTGAKIGRGCIINTCASVDHDCILADYVHIAVGAHVAGTVSIGVRTWIGAGAVVSNNIDICKDCMIGAGAVVVGNINEIGTYIGVPARRKK